MYLAIIGLVVGGIGLVWVLAILAGRAGRGRWNGSGYDYGSGGDWSDGDSGSGFWPSWLWWNSSPNDNPSGFESCHHPVAAADAGSMESASPAVDCGSSFSSDGGGFSGDSGSGGCDCGSSGGGDCGGGGGGE